MPKKKTPVKPSHSIPPWPRCCECGGPARPKTKPAFVIEYECDTQSEANIRGRWGKMTRAANQRDTTFNEIAVALHEGKEIPKRGPWFVRFTRLAFKELDENDNLPRSMKAIRDQFAAILGVNDGSKSVYWDYEQVLGCQTKAVRIEVWGS